MIFYVILFSKVILEILSVIKLLQTKSCEDLLKYCMVEECNFENFICWENFI